MQLRGVLHVICLLLMSFIITSAQVDPSDSGVDTVIDHTLRASPYNALAYGLLVLGSWFIIWVFYRNWKSEEEYSKQLSTQSLELQKEVLQMLVKVEIRLTDQRDHGDKIRDLLSMVTTIKQHVEESKNMLIHLPAPKVQRK